MIPNKFRPALNTRIAAAIICSAAAVSVPSRLDAAAYASGISFLDPTTVSFTLNEPADVLSVSINGGPAIILDGTTSGTKTFTLGSASDKFAITAIKNDPIGYTIPTGATIAAASNSLSQATAEGGFRLISSDLNPLVRFNSPRGVTVATNPNNPQFGTAYISNSASGTTTGVVRNVGDGLYALKADQSDAFGYGNTAQTTGFEITADAASPFRISVGSDHNVYIADFSDPNGGVYRTDGKLKNPAQVLKDVGGPSTLPAERNHGSTTAVYVSGSAAGDLTVYTLDEDLTSSQFGGGSTTDKNSLWRYDIGSSAQPYDGTPTKVAGVLVSGASSDMDRGRNGNFYLSQNRSNAFEGGIIVLSPEGSVLFNSLTATRSLPGSTSSTIDIFRSVQGIAVSLDQGYLAVMLNNSDIAVMPLDPSGIPDITKRMIINTGPDINSGRDIAFDAAGNIHYVSSGQGLYRVLAPGGYTEATTSWDGTSYGFVVVPEPSSALLIGAGAMLLMRRRQRICC